MDTRLKTIRVAGWKSIKDSRPIELGPLNVFIGANGSGKSNLVSFFKLLNEIIGERLQEFIGTAGGANSVLHYGSKVTVRLESRLDFETPTGLSGYVLRLAHAAIDTLIFTEERLEFHRSGYLRPKPILLGVGHKETLLGQQAKGGDKTAAVLRHLVGSCRVYQFHDTSNNALIRQQCYLGNNRFLMPDGGNVAAMLYRFKESDPVTYNRIVGTIRQVAPFFGDFDLEPLPNSPNIILNWRERGVDQIFGPHQISDGTLRAIALITLLLQPETSLPTVIVIDEPELGLHPFAIGVLASLIKKASQHCQIILATQSAALLDHFNPEDVVIVDRRDRESTFNRLPPKELESWLDEYTLSEIWEKNVFGGGPY
jgi:predicted ATPase